MYDLYQNLDNNYFKSVYFNIFVVYFRFIKERRFCVLFGKKDKIKDIKKFRICFVIMQLLYKNIDKVKYFKFQGIIIFCVVCLIKIKKYFSVFVYQNV